MSTCSPESQAPGTLALLSHISTAVLVFDFVTSRGNCQPDAHLQLLLRNPPSTPRDPSNLEKMAGQASCVTRSLSFSRCDVIRGRSSGLSRCACWLLEEEQKTYEARLPARPWTNFRGNPESFGLSPRAWVLQQPVRFKSNVQIRNEEKLAHTKVHSCAKERSPEERSATWSLWLHCILRTADSDRPGSGSHKFPEVLPPVHANI